MMGQLYQHRPTLTFHQVNLKRFFPVSTQAAMFSAPHHGSVP